MIGDVAPGGSLGANDPARGYVAIDDPLRLTIEAKYREDAAAFDEAHTELGRSLYTGMMEDQAGYAQATKKFGGKYYSSLDKDSRKFDKSRSKLIDWAQDGLFTERVARDQMIYSAGATPPMDAAVIARAAEDGTLYDLADTHVTIPLAQAATREMMDTTPYPPVLDPDPPLIPPPMSPPPPRTIRRDPLPAPLAPPPPMIVRADPLPGDPVDPPIGPGVPIGGPGSDPTCLPWQGVSIPTSAIILPAGRTPGPGYVVIANALTGGCQAWMPVPPPPVVPPPPALPPTPPPVDFPPPDADWCGVGTAMSCFTVPVSRLALYWYDTRCLPGCEAEVCSYYGTVTPPLRVGYVRWGPYTAAQSDPLVLAWARGCHAATVPPAEPLPPPASPPASPPGDTPAPPPPAPPVDVGVQPLPPFDLQSVPGVDQQVLCDRLTGELDRIRDATTEGMFSDSGRAMTDAIAAATDDQNWVLRFAGGVLSTVIRSASSIAVAAYNSVPIADKQANGFLGASIGIMTWIERLTGIPMRIPTRVYEQMQNYTSPVDYPSQAEANGSYLANVIDQSEWECLTRINGNRVGPAWDAMYAGRTRPGVQDIIFAWRRGLIDTPTRDTKLRSLGMIFEGDRDVAVAMTVATPTPTDLVSWMKKDVLNEKLVFDSKLSDGFVDTFVGPMVTWADAVGVTKEQMELTYRASWTTPSNTQAYEMLHRLRPGRVQPFPVSGPDGKVELVTPTPVQTGDVLRLFKLNDVAPGWQDRLLAISYHPITLTDIKTLVKNRVIEGEEVTERLMDVGYSPADAPVMAEMISRDAARMVSNETGGWTRRRTTAEYLEGNISSVQAANYLGRTIPSADQVAEIIADTDQLRLARSRRVCIKGIRRRYFTGEIDDGDANTMLATQGVEADVAATLMTQWSCERHSRSKEPRVQMIQEWWRRGIISDVEALLRLKRIGHPQEDAERIFATTQLAERERLAKEARARAKEADAERRRIIREEQQRQDRLRREAEKRKKEEEKRKKEEEKKNPK